MGPSSPWPRCFLCRAAPGPRREEAGDGCVLRHHRDPVRQRRAAPRLRARAGPGGRLRPVPPAPRGRHPLPDRHRREQPHQRAGGGARWSPGARPGRPACRALPGADVGAGHLERRLHPDRDRPPSPHRRSAVLGGLRRARRRLPTSVSGALLRSVRALLRAGRAGGRAVPGARDRARGGRGGELLLPSISLRRRPRATPRRGTPPGDPGGAPAGDPCVRRARARGLQRLTIACSGARLGDRGAGRSGASDVRLVRRPDELRHGTGLRRRPGDAALRAVLAGEPGPRARDREGHPAISRGLLARDVAVGRRRGADDDLRPRLPDARRAEDEQVARHRGRSLRARAGLGCGRGALLAASPRARDRRRRIQRRGLLPRLFRRAGRRSGEPRQPRDRDAPSISGGGGPGTGRRGRLRAPSAGGTSFRLPRARAGRRLRPAGRARRGVHAGRRCQPARGAVAAVGIGSRRARGRRERGASTRYGTLRAGGGMPPGCGGAATAPARHGRTHRRRPGRAARGELGPGTRVGRAPAWSADWPAHGPLPTRRPRHRASGRGGQVGPVSGPRGSAGTGARPHGA